MFSMQFISVLYRVPVLLVSLTIHELAHGYMSYRLGDPTAKEAGRLTLNPIKHIDPIGALMLLVVGFGWAKPVPINSSYYKNKRAGIVLTSFAGPLSNLLLATLFAILFTLSVRHFTGYYISTFQSVVLTLIRWYFIPINIILAAFNLLPIPPLDGSKILFSILPQQVYYNYVLRYERYGMFILLALSFTGILSMLIIPVTDVIYGIINSILKLFFH